MSCWASLPGELPSSLNLAYSNRDSHSSPLGFSSPLLFVAHTKARADSDSAHLRVARSLRSSWMRVSEGKGSAVAVVMVSLSQVMVRGNPLNKQRETEACREE